MAALLAVVAFLIALVFQLADIAFGHFNYVSVALIGFALLAAAAAGLGGPWRRASA